MNDGDKVLEFWAGCLAGLAIPAALVLGVVMRLGRVTLRLVDWALS